MANAKSTVVTDTPIIYANRWTKRDKREFIRLVEDGWSDRRIAQFLKKTVDEVQRHRMRVEESGDDLERKVALPVGVYDDPELASSALLADLKKVFGDNGSYPEFNIPAQYQVDYAKVIRVDGSYMQSPAALCAEYGAAEHA